MLGNSKAKVFDIWKFRQVGSGSKLHGFVLLEQGGVSRRVHQPGSMEIGENCAPSGKAPGQPKRILKESASARDQHCGRKLLSWAQAWLWAFVAQPSCRCCRCKSATSRSRAGNGDCDISEAPERESVNSSPKGYVVRADCGSVLLVTATKSQPSAWRKPQRVLRMSVDRKRPGNPGTKAAADEDGFAETDSRFAWKREFRDEAVEKSRHDEPFGASRVRRSCRAEVRLAWTAWRESRRIVGRRPTVMLR